MSDLFKKHRPTLTDEEDRRLWQRVRVPVAQSPVRASWWRSLTAMPAVRYGVPALAVVLVAVVWVVDRAPRAPVRDMVGTQAMPEGAPAPVSGSGSGVDQPAAEQQLHARRSNAAPAPANEQKAGKRSAISTMPAERQDEGALDEKNVGKKEEASQLLESREEGQSKDQATRMVAPAPSPVAPPAVAPKQKVGGESDREFARAPVKSGAPAPVAEAPAAGAAAPSSQQPPAALGKTMAFFRDSRPDASAEAIITSVLDPAHNGALLGAASGPFADSPSRLVAVVAAGPVRLKAGESTRRELVADIEAGSVSVHRITGDGRVVATLDGTGGGRALELDAPATPYARAEPRMQLALLAIEYAHALEVRESTPRARLEALRDAARRVAERGGPGVPQGAARLIGMIEGSLTGWPSR